MFASYTTFCFVLALGGSTMGKTFEPSGGTLAIFIPTSAGLVIAADMRQSPLAFFVMESIRSLSQRDPRVPRSSSSRARQQVYETRRTFQQANYANTSHA